MFIITGAIRLLNPEFGPDLEPLHAVIPALMLPEMREDGKSSFNVDPIEPLLGSKGCTGEVALSSF